VSFGSERPAVEGDDEAAWAQNRRVELVYAAVISRAAVGRASILSAACLAVLALAGCATTPPEEDPVQIKLNDLDTRLARIERVVANQSLLDLSNQIEALRTDVRAMHNDVDVLNHTLEASRKQQHDLYADLDQRHEGARNAGCGGGRRRRGRGCGGVARMRAIRPATRRRLRSPEEHSVSIAPSQPSRIF
jgi:outer membrane murein-binding lipoprotein Lpp